MFQVLVVEDDKKLNHTVCAYLNQNGFEAQSAYEPEELTQLLPLCCIR